MSKNETGGGEGVEVVKNEPFGPDKTAPMPVTPLLDGRADFQTGQYTYKWYHLQRYDSTNTSTNGLIDDFT